MKTKVNKTLIATLVWLASGTMIALQAQPCNTPDLIYSMPVVKTNVTSPAVAGVNYGCSSQTAFDYYAFNVCTAGSLNMEINASSGNDIDMVIYGPFTTSANNCAQLTAPNIVGCGTTVTNNLIVNVPSASTGYYVMAVYTSTINSITIDNSGTALVDSSCVNFSCYSTAQDHFCLATVDSATQKYKLIWEETPGLATDYYTIYKQNTQAVFAPIGTVPFSSLSEFVDMGSNPAVHTESYKLSRTDSCGYTVYSTFINQPLHLNTSVNNALGQVALSWNSYIGGANPVINYIISRGTAPGMEIPLDTVPLSVTAYMDLSPVPGANYYKIEATVTNSCTPMRANGLAVSNTSLITVTGIGDQQLENNLVTLYPNPANENLNITVNGHTLNAVQVFDASGRIAFDVQNLETSQYNVDLSTVSKGYYIVHIVTSEGKFTRLPFIRN